MNSNLTENLHKALGIFLEAMRQYISLLMYEQYGKTWDQEYYDGLSEGQQKQWNNLVAQQQGRSAQMMIDYANLGSFAIKQKALLKKDFGRDTNKLPTMFDQIGEVRHALAHYDTLDPDQSQRAFINMLEVSKKLKMPELTEALSALRDGKSDSVEARAPLATTRTVTAPIAWFNNVTPHWDIVQGNLDESVFAANLGEVALGAGREVYNNPSLFFDKTYFTSGLRNLSSRIIRALNGTGDGQNRVITLQTGFGGGKTHALISLYHLAKGGARIVDRPAVKELMAHGDVPTFEEAHVAVFTNQTNDPVQGRQMDGLHLRTIWGEIAYQLGGKQAYELIAPNDQDRVAPKGRMQALLAQCTPALILIDELADYCVAASGVNVGNSTLADQTISFMQELSEAVSQTPGAAMVVTLPASEKEVANSPNATAILSSLSSRVARVGADTKPVDDDEIFEVIRYRLFTDLGNLDVSESVLSAYMEMYEGLRSELPQQAMRSDYRDLLRRSYPFHPELINIFRNRWASHPSFQRTRGVLRLLASIVADLWKRRQTLSGVHALIHPSHVLLANLDTLTGEIKRLYGNGYDAVVTQDVSGVSSNAYFIDQEKPEYGHHQLAQGLAATIFLASFGSEGPNKGISVKDIKLSALAPGGFNHNSINGALDELEARAYYLYYTSTGAIERKYWFHTKPNLNILINKTKAEVKSAQIEGEIVNFLTPLKDRVQKFKISVAPTTDLPEQRSPIIILMHPSQYVNGNSETLEEIKRIATKKGNTDRLYRNTMLFLSTSEQGRARLYDDVREYLACKKVQTDYTTQLDQDQTRELKARIEEARTKYGRSVVNAYSQLHKYVSSEGLRTLVIREFLNDIQAQIDSTMYSALKTEEWLIESIGANTLRKHNLYPEGDKRIRVVDIYEAFLRFDDKPVISSKSALTDTVVRYCYNGQFALAAMDQGTIRNAYFKTVVNSLDIEDESYELISLEEYQKWQEAQTPSSPGDSPQLPIGDRPNPVAPPSDDPDKPSPITFHRLTISGKVDPSNYNQLFSSFVFPLMKNKVQIEIRISAVSTESHPITENSDQYKVTKESAKQLGLGFEAE